LIFPRRANFDKKNPNRFLFSCANSGEKFVATLAGSAGSMILKFLVHFFSLVSTFSTDA
jgi:hypothetical protein